MFFVRDSLESSPTLYQTPPKWCSISVQYLSCFSVFMCFFRLTRRSVLLSTVQLNRGIHSTLLIHEDRLQYSTGSLIEDPLSMVAHLQELLGSATDLSKSPSDQ